MKEFIESHTALNHRELCRLIDWSPSSFKQWMKGVRGIPDDKAERMFFRSTDLRGKIEDDTNIASIYV